jgi:uncharacterized protein YxjI
VFGQRGIHLLGCRSQSAVDPSTSVKRKLTTPEGGDGMDTPEALLTVAPCFHVCVISIASRRWIEIQEKRLSVRDKIEIEFPGGWSATVNKALVGFRDRFHVEVDDGPDLKVHGNIVDHEYEIERDGDKIAEVSQKWFRVRDTYGVEVFDEQETVLILAITVAVDALAHDLG